MIIDNNITKLLHNNEGELADLILSEIADGELGSLHRLNNLTDLPTKVQITMINMMRNTRTVCNNECTSSHNILNMIHVIYMILIKYDKHYLIENISEVNDVITHIIKSNPDVLSSDDHNYLFTLVREAIQLLKPPNMTESGCINDIICFFYVFKTIVSYVDLLEVYEYDRYKSMNFDDTKYSEAFSKLLQQRKDDQDNEPHVVYGVNLFTMAVSCAAEKLLELTKPIRQSVLAESYVLNYEENSYGVVYDGTTKLVARDLFILLSSITGSKDKVFRSKYKCNAYINDNLTYFTTLNNILDYYDLMVNINNGAAFGLTELFVVLNNQSSKITISADEYLIIKAKYNKLVKLLSPNKNVKLMILSILVNNDHHDMLKNLMIELVGSYRFVGKFISLMNLTYKDAITSDKLFNIISNIEGIKIDNYADVVLSEMLFIENSLVRKLYEKYPDMIMFGDINDHNCLLSILANDEISLKLNESEAI